MLVNAVEERGCAGGKEQRGAVANKFYSKKERKNKNSTIYFTIPLFLVNELVLNDLVFLAWALHQQNYLESSVQLAFQAAIGLKRRCDDCS